MANQTLLVSSMICSVINICLFLLCEYYCFIPGHKQCPSQLRLIELLSIMIIITSILNHGYTNVYYKWMDRVIVYLCLLLSIHISVKYNIQISWIIIIVCIGLYIMAKTTELSIYHVMIHLLMTTNNIIYFMLIP